MAIFKRGTVWWIDIALANGKRLRKSAETPHRKAAQELHDQLKAALWRQTHLGEKPVRSFADAADKWLAENSHLDALVDFKHHLTWWKARAEGLTVAEVTREFAADAIDTLRVKGGKHPSAGTKNNYVATLRSVMNTAVREWEWLDHAPAFRTYGEKRQQRCIASAAQAQALVDVMPERLKAPILFAFMTGLRKGNVFGLQWDRVDLERSICWVEESETKAGNLIVVPLNSVTREMLIRLAKARVGLEPRVFPVEPPCHHQWKRYVKRAGLPEAFRFHDIRHTFASWHSMAGTERKVIQDLGGWMTSAMVDNYVHLPSAHLVQAQEKLAGLLN